MFCAVASTGTPSVDERVSVNNGSVSEVYDLLESDKTDSDWSLTDRLPSQQAADMIWYIHRVACDCDMYFSVV